MRNLIRKLINESLLKESSQKDLVLSSGKVLPNFAGVMNSLTSGSSHVKQAISVMEMIPEYSISNEQSFVEPMYWMEYYNTQRAHRNPFVKAGYEGFNALIYVSDDEVANAIVKHIKQHSGYIGLSSPTKVTMLKDPITLCHAKKLKLMGFDKTELDSLDDIVDDDLVYGYDPQRHPSGLCVNYRFYQKRKQT